MGAYSPLAGGLLAKKHLRCNLPQKRVDDNPFYFGEACLSAADVINSACQAADISVLQATYSWFFFHSALRKGDGIVLGASSVSQLEQNLEACQKARPMCTSVVDAFAKAWAPCRPTAYLYWRLYSKDMPNRDVLVKELPGALFHCTQRAKRSA